MFDTRKNKIESKNPEFWFLLLVSAGYLIASGLAIPLGIEEKSRYFAVPFRIIIFLFSLFIIFRNFSSKKITNFAILSFAAFWIFYSVKVILSFYNDSYSPAVLEVWNEIYARIGLIVFFPSLGLLLINYQQVNLKLLGMYIFCTYLIMLVLNLFFGFLTAKEFLLLPSIFSVYYISYGHLGTSLALISLFFLLFTNYNRLLAFFYSLGLFIGLFTLFIATARSPFLALVVVTLFLLVIKGNIKLIVIYFSLVLLAVLGIWYYVENGYTYFKFITRTYAWLFEGDNSLRTPLFEKSVELFRVNPIVGSRILYEDGSYPHNIFLELLMATGVIGFLLYWLKFIPVLKSWKQFTMKSGNIFYVLFFTLFLQYFVLVVTSYNLFSVPEFVHFSAIVIGIALNYQYEKTQSDDRRGDTAGNYKTFPRS